MSEPVVQRSPGILTFTWDDSPIKVIVSRFKEKDETGELRILHNEGVQMYHSKFNFMSAQVLNREAKLLKEKNADYEWEILLKQVCRDTIKLMREGEPVQYISVEGDIVPQKWLVYPILPRMEPTIIFGSGGVGKSLMGQLLYTLVTSPGAKDDPVIQALGLGLRQEPVIGLYLDWERNYYTMKWRIQCLARGMSLFPPDMIYKRMSNSFANDIEAVQSVIAQTRAEFIVIDSLTGAVGGDFNKSEPANDFFAALRSLDVSSLILGHPAKGDDKERSVIGSTIFNDRASYVWEQLGYHDEETNVISIALKHKKTNISEFMKPLGFQVRISGDSISVTRDDRQAKEVLPPTATEVIIRELSGGAKTYSELNLASGIEINGLRQAMSRLQVKGEVCKVGNNKYGLRYE